MTYIKVLPLTPHQAKELSKQGFYLKYLGITSKTRSMFQIFAKQGD